MAMTMTHHLIVRLLSDAKEMESVIPKLANGDMVVRLRPYIENLREAARLLEGLTLRENLSQQTFDDLRKQIERLVAMDVEREKWYQVLVKVHERLQTRHDQMYSALQLARNMPECPPAIRALADKALEEKPT